jgi:hypothetical protein
MQRREAKIGLRDRKRHQRPEGGNDTGENPPETGRFKSASKSAVRKDWMVGTTGIEPVTPTMSRLCPHQAGSGGSLGINRAQGDGLRA